MYRAVPAKKDRGGAEQEGMALAVGTALRLPVNGKGVFGIRGVDLREDLRRSGDFSALWY